MDVYVHPEKPLAYLPTSKNASTTFVYIFKNSGWNLQQLDHLNDSYQVFGHFRDPIERHFKGTVEFLLIHKITHLIKDPNWKKIWMSAVFDMHSYPITWALGARADRVKWIPIHRKIPTNYLTHRFLLSHGIDYNLQSVVWRNEANFEKQRIYSELRELHSHEPTNLLSFFYDSDILVWNKILPYTDEDNVTYYKD